MMRFTDRPPEPPRLMLLVDVLLKYHSYDPIEPPVPFWPQIDYGDLDGECDLCGKAAMFNRCPQHAYGKRRP